MVPRVKGSSVVSASTWVAAVRCVPSLMLGTSTCPEHPPPQISHDKALFTCAWGDGSLSGSLGLGEELCWEQEALT